MNYSFTKIVLYLLLYSNLTFGQDYYFKHYKVENGLSNSTVLTSTEDEDGFMWFGTKDGLNRFDGYRFKVYRNDPKNPNTLGSNFISAMHQYRGALWIGTDKGLFKYQKEFDNFIPVNEKINGRIGPIHNDDDGNLWYVSDLSLYKYDVEKNKITAFNEQNSFETGAITTTEDGELWASSFNKIYRYSKSASYFEPMALEFYAAKSPLFIITTIYALDNSTILIGTQDHGILSYDIHRKTVSQLSINTTEPLHVRQFQRRGLHELWIASEIGVIIYNTATKETVHLRKNFDDPYSISDNASYSITVDNTNGIWIGTYFGGVNYYQPQYTQFKKYFQKNNGNSIKGGAVREIHKDDFGNIWIGTEDAGINKYNPKTNTFTNYTVDGTRDGLSYYNIHGLLPRKNELWIGTFEHGLNVMDIHTGKIVKKFSIGAQSGNLKSNFIFNFYELQNGRLIVLTSRGIYWYNEEEELFFPLDGFPETLHYTTFLEDSNGVYWAGTYRSGLYQFNPKTNKQTIFTYNSKVSESISNNSINSIFESNAHIILITTENGINLFDRKTKTFKKLSTEIGLPSNVSYSILQDNKNQLWITTSKGLVRFEPKDSSIKVFTTDNGLLSDQFNYNSAFKDTDGTMYFGNLDGMISFNPEEFTTYNYDTPIFITGLQINNNDVNVGSQDSPLDTSIVLTKNIELKNKNSSFNIEFASLCYTAPELTEYWYKLEPNNEDWIFLNHNNKVFFTELPTGRYSFKVKSLDSNGVWSKEASLGIRILPPFWASIYAYFAYFLIFMLGSYILLRFYHHKNEQKNLLNLARLNNEKEKEIYQAKIEFFTNIAHEIRTPLTLIKLPLDNLLKKQYTSADIPKDLSIMEKNTSRLIHLVNELLDFRKAEMEGVKLTFIETNISNLVRNLNTRFSQKIEENCLEITLDLGDNDIYAFVDKETLRKIFGNIFGNAVKYAKSKVIVRLFQDEINFYFTVKNDGNIIPEHLQDKIFEPFFRIINEKSSMGTGIGLPLSLSLTELHNGTLVLDKSDKTLNSFILTLPIHQENEFHSFTNITDTQEEKTSNDIETRVIKSQILVVEDNKELLNLICKELSIDFKVYKALNGEEALSIIQNKNIHLVISDITMPIMDGITLCERLKTNIETSHIPVILLTAKSTLQSKISGLESGADAYIFKPFSMEHVKAQVENLLSNRKNVLNYYSSSPLSYLKSFAHNKSNQDFINKLDAIIYENIEDTNLSVESLAEIMNMSRSTLYRKIKDISDLSPNELINTARLKKAIELLNNNEYKVYEIAEIVGYKSQSSFVRNFQKQFDMTPSKFKNSENTSSII
ncbi:hybrid sensor histidine kinase/response regulator transcription factor [Gelidibacter mesophilus]|uniref:hybrid sensor histidine kinase/response regulator transcription factor n=1 Tax=Gelidibacter mesophilus TaxID=169050 RepID=UPI000416E446|nr:hybrid sensor histidine kinase/response regulator transcription factor [Gelidibacter mesophilus]